MTVTGRPLASLLQSVQNDCSQNVRVLPTNTVPRDITSFPLQSKYISFSLRGESSHFSPSLSLSLSLSPSLSPSHTHTHTHTHTQASANMWTCMSTFKYGRQRNQNTTKRYLKQCTFWLVRLHCDLPIGGCSTEVKNRISVVPTAAAYYWASRIRYKTFMSVIVLGRECSILGSSVSLLGQ